MRTDGQTGTTKLIVAFRNFANAPKMVKNFKKTAQNTALSLQSLLALQTSTAAVQLRFQGRVPVRDCVTTLCIDVSNYTAVVHIQGGSNMTGTDFFL